jgi:pimeloyl-ACP methyl ester carboxylesterase
MTYYPIVNVAEGLAARTSSGTGERVMWIHPYALDSSCWGELWDLLPGWHHIGIDLPGHGLSLPLDAKDELPNLARRLAGVAIEREVRHVVGLSFGTIVALQMAIEFPTAFASLVLGSPLVGDGANDELFWKRYREMANMYRMAGHGDHLRGRLMLVEPSPFEGVQGRKELWDRMWGIVGKHPFWDLKDAALQRLGAYPQSDVKLRGIESAVLLVVGEKERAASKRHAERLSRTLRDTRSLHILGASAHSLLESPDSAAAAIESHLRANAQDRSPSPDAGGAA